MPEYRVLLRGLKDQTEEGRRQFLQRFGDSYKMSAEQAAQWLKTRKGVVYAVKTPEAAEKARRYIESLGGVAEVEKVGGGQEASRSEPARLDLDETAGKPAAPVAPAPPPPAAPAAPVPVEDAFVTVGGKDAAPAPASAPPPVPGGDAFTPPAPSVDAPTAAAASSVAAAMRACPHCGFPFLQTLPVCPACKRPPVYNAGPTARAAYAAGPGGYHPPGPSPGYDLSAIFNLTIETYKNNFATLYALSVAPTVLIFGMAALAGVVLAGFAAMGEQVALAAAAGLALLAVVLLPLVLYGVTWLSAGLFAAIDVAIRGVRPDPIGILKTIPPIMPLKVLVNGLAAFLLMALALSPFIGVIIWASLQKFIALAVVTGLAMFPVAAFLGMMMMLVWPVTILEGPWAVQAIQRSGQLGSGYLIRNFAIMFLISITAGIIIAIISMPINMIPVLGPLLSPLVQALATPVTTIPIVLLYYDMKLKKGEN